MDLGIAGKFALVCGASKGLGFGCAQALVREVARRTIPRSIPCSHGCDRALDTAIITPRDAWPEETRARLATLSPRTFADA